MGMIPGSAMANVVTTGTFSIPLMKRVGFSANYAAGVESMASTGGQLTPPIMGVAAFIMAQYSGIPYSEIAWAAAIPAALYYSCGLWQIHFHAVRQEIPVIPRSALPNPWTVFKAGWYFISPLIVIVGVLVSGRTAISAAIWGLATIFVAGFLFGIGKIFTLENFY